MVFKRRFKRRKMGRKSYRQRWRSKAKGRGQFGVRYLKLRSVVKVDTSISGTALASFSTRNPISAQDWSNTTALFDAYKVCAFKLQFIPHFPPGNSLTVDYQPIYLAFDNNSTSGTPPATIAEMIQYENMKYKNIFKPWNYYVRIPTLQTTGQSTGYAGTAAPIDQGRVYFRAEGLDVSTVDYGTIVISWYIKFKERL